MEFILFLKIGIVNWIILLFVIYLDKYIFKNLVESNEVIHVFAGLWAFISLIYILCILIWFVIKL